MFTINDGYINALTEALDNSKSKYKSGDKLTSNDLLISNIPDLYNCAWDLEFKDLVVCDNCHAVISRDEIVTQTREVEYGVDAWDYIRGEYYEKSATGELDYETCPNCNIGEDEDEEFEYHPLSLETLIDDIDTLVDLDYFVEDGFIEAMKKYIAEQNGDTEIKTESKEEKQKPEKDDEDYTKLKETVKKEMYKYLKDNGIDVEHLRKAGVELNSMKSVIDKMLDTYVATSIADYENEFNIGLSWDYMIDNNDIIITIETM